MVARRERRPAPTNFLILAAETRMIVKATCRVSGFAERRTQTRTRLIFDKAFILSRPILLICMLPVLW